MMTRRPLWLLALGAALLACATFLPAEPTPTPAPAPEAPGSGLIAYLGSDGNIYTVSQGGDDRTAVTDDAFQHTDLDGSITIYQSLTWSPDGLRLAYVRFEILDGLSKAHLMVYEPAGGESSEIFASDVESPFYLYWSPTSDRITFLTSFPGTNELNLRMAFLDGAESSVLDMGQPYYWVWSPDGTQIFTHVGGAQTTNPEARVAILSPSGEALQTFDFSPDVFQAPSWSPDGSELMFGLQGEGRGRLVLTDREGANLQTLTEYDPRSRIAFSWSPDGAYIATLSTQVLSSGYQGTLVVLSSESGETLAVVPETVLAFFWSPDSRKIAYLASTLNDGVDALIGSNAQASRDLALSVLDVESGVSRLLANFRPTRDFLSVIPFFDQYHHSATIWSPDSSRLVYTASEENDVSGVYVMAADGSEPPLRLGDGSIAFWSWR